MPRRKGGSVRERQPACFPVSLSGELIAKQIDNIRSHGDFKGASFRKVAVRDCGTALGSGTACPPPAAPFGRRISMPRRSARDLELQQRAKELNPESPYSYLGYPGLKELGEVTRFRFRMLRNAAHCDTVVGREADDPACELALRIACHPSPEDIAAVLDVIWNNKREFGPNARAETHAWRGDLVRLRPLLRGRNLIVTPDFKKRFASLIAAEGVNGAILRVLEQAFEFERTCDYVRAHLELFPISDNAISSELRFADLEPILMYPGAFGVHALIPGQPANHAKLASDVLRRFRPARNRPTPPDEHSPHSILGFTTLEFLLIYFFSCHERFKRFTGAPGRGREAFKLESALFRLALNVLAAIDPDEAGRELAARLSQKKLSHQGSPRRTIHERAAQSGLAAPRSLTEFDLFNGELAGPLGDLIGDPDWMAGWVSMLWKTYARMVDQGLHAPWNPFARAFPLPEAWSEPRPLKWLDHWYGFLSDDVAKLDPRYTPISSTGGKASSAIKFRDLQISLELATAIIEMPNPISMAKSFSLSLTQLRSFNPAAQKVTAWSPQRLQKSTIRKAKKRKMNDGKY